MLHTIDLLQWIMRKAIRVNGNVKILTHEIEGEDVGVANLKSENGALDLTTSSASTYLGLKEELGIYGSGGSLELKGSEIVTWKPGIKRILSKKWKRRKERSERFRVYRYSKPSKNNGKKF